MGSSQRNKGAGGERELVKVLNDLGFDVHRGYVFYHEPDVIGIPGIHIECKRVEKLDIKKAMEQAISESKKKDGGTPCVFHRVNRKPWMVTMRDIDWLELFQHSGCLLFDYFHLENKLVTTLLDEWAHYYKVFNDMETDGSLTDER